MCPPFVYERPLKKYSFVPFAQFFVVFVVKSPAANRRGISWYETLSHYLCTMSKILFDPHIASLREIILKGKNQKNKGEAFFKNGGRNVLFRLEALCRAYRGITNKKFFDTWYKQFKLVEDMLGDMDHQLAMHEHFSSVSGLQKASEKTFMVVYHQYATMTTEALTNGGFLNGSALKEFEEGLQMTDWPEGDKNKVEFALAICTELEKVEDKYRHGEIDPWDLEKGLHEIRRRLRWVSIYAQVAHGWVQLRKSPFIPEELEDYCTEEILKSPYNVLPKKPTGVTPLYVQSNYFYALSWMIQYLGDLKDEGLILESFDLLKKENKISEKDLKAAKELLPDSTLSELSYEAERALDKFFYDDYMGDRIVRDLIRSTQ